MKPGIDARVGHCGKVSGASKVGFSQLYVNEERENASVGQSDWFSRFDNFKMEEQLIVCVSAHPILYNTSLFDYRDVNKKNDAWRRVAEVVGVPGVYFVLL